MNLVDLEVLRIGNAAFESIEFIGKLPKLRKLELRDCGRLQSIQPLAGLQSLTHLEIDSCPIADVSIVENLTTLEKLDLQHVRVPNVDFVTGLGSLQNLELSHTGVADIRCLEKLVELKFVTVLERQSKFTGIEGLYKLPKLERVALAKKSIKEGSKAVKSFEKQRPDVRFRFR